MKGSRGVQVVFDYVDPGSYLVQMILERWNSVRGGEVSISWVPLELRLPSSPALDPRDPAWVGLVSAMEAEAAAEAIAFRPPVIIPGTRKAHELALHAREKGCFDEVHRAIFEAYFVRGEDIGRVDVLTALAAESGLDRGETRTVLGVDRFLEEVEAARSRARGLGVRGVPTIELPGLRLEGFESGLALRRALDDFVANEC